MLVLIPCGGKGKRFKDAGYDAPKHLLPIEGKNGSLLPMKFFTKEDLCHRLPKAEVHVMQVPNSPSVLHTITQWVRRNIPQNDPRWDEPVVVNNVDNLVQIDLSEAVRTFESGQWDFGVIVFPINYMTDEILRFSFVEVDPVEGFPHILEVHEKQDPSREGLAVAGVYWFSSLWTLVDSCDQAIQEGREVEECLGKPADSTELYLSHAMNTYLSTRGGRVFMMPREAFMEYGTPESYEETRRTLNFRGRKE